MISGEPAVGEPVSLAVADGRVVGELRSPSAESVLEQMKRLGG